MTPPQLVTPHRILGAHATLPSHPPQLWSPMFIPTNNSSNTEPFTLVMLSGLISTCFGCRNNFIKPPKSPYDMVIRHKDNRPYIDPDGIPKQKYGNVYYHVNANCITRKQPQFTPAMLVVPPQVQERATRDHADYLQAMMGISLTVHSPH